MDAPKLVKSLKAGTVELVVRTKGNSEEVRVRFDLVRLHVTAMARNFTVNSFEVGKLNVIRRGVRGTRRHSLHVKVGEL